MKRLLLIVFALALCFSCATAKMDTVPDGKFEEPKNGEEKKEKEKEIPPWVKYPRERPSRPD